MSRQNKQAKRAVLAAEFTQLHKNGDRGPAKTTPKKRVGRHRDGERQAARAEALSEMRNAKYKAVLSRWGRQAKVTPW
jgi:hypothetical protein